MCFDSGGWFPDSGVVSTLKELPLSPDSARQRLSFDAAGDLLLCTLFLFGFGHFHASKRP